MKISNNTTKQGTRWRWNFVRLLAAGTISSAFVFPHRAGDLIGIGTLLFGAGFVLKVREEDWQVHVFDDGDCIRLELGEVRFSADLTKIEKVIFQDGNDGIDLVTISFMDATPFGHHIEFIPVLHYKFGGSEKLMFDDLKSRISKAKAEAAAKNIDEPADTSLECFSPSGQHWM